jgi:hypothetical protein
MNNLTDLFVWLSGPGAIALVAWFVSWALIEVSAWQKLPAQSKSLLILLAAALIGIGATFVIQNPTLYAPLEPYGKALLAVIGAWLSTQVAYRTVKAKVE